MTNANAATFALCFVRWVNVVVGGMNVSLNFFTFLNLFFMPNIDLQNIDCMQLMAQYPDKYFDLAIVDPQYGIGWTDTIDYKDNQKANQVKHGYKLHEKKEWDNKPMDKDYFIELQRVSKNQIIWGANYFLDKLPNPNTKCMIYWNKMNKKFTAITDEIAWTSFNRKPFEIELNGNTEKGFLSKGHIHPTQKPVKLYEILLRNFAKEGQLILDTHGGSFNSAKAAYNLGFDFVGCEIDKGYYDKAMDSFKMHSSQLLITL